MSVESEAIRYAWGADGDHVPIPIDTEEQPGGVDALPMAGSDRAPEALEVQPLGQTAGSVDTEPEIIEAEVVDRSDGRQGEAPAPLELESVERAPERSDVGDESRELGASDAGVGTLEPEWEQPDAPAAVAILVPDKTPPTPEAPEQPGPASASRRLIPLVAAAAVLVLGGAWVFLAQRAPHRVPTTSTAPARVHRTQSIVPANRWLFPALTRSFDQVILVVTNPARMSATVMITVAGRNGAVVRRVRVPPAAQAEVALVPPAGGGPIVVQSTMPIVVQRVSIRHGHARAEIGQAVVLGNSPVAAAARSATAKTVWNIPAPKDSSGRVITLSNPGRTAVAVQVVLTGSSEHLWWGNLGGAKRITIQLPGQIRSGITVRASTPIFVRQFSSTGRQQP